MKQQTIDVPLTLRQLEYMIALIHVDNSFRKVLEDHAKQLKSQLKGGANEKR